MWSFSFVVPIRGHFDFSYTSLCGRVGFGLASLWPFRWCPFSVCDRFRLWPFRLWSFRSVTFMIYYIFIETHSLRYINDITIILRNNVLHKIQSWCTSRNWLVIPNYSFLVGKYHQDCACTLQMKYFFHWPIGNVWIKFVQISSWDNRNSLQWGHNERDCVSNHRPHDYLLNRIFKAQITENIKAPRHWPLRGEFTGGGWIPRTKGQ